MNIEDFETLMKFAHQIARKVKPDATYSLNHSEIRLMMSVRKNPLQAMQYYSDRLKVDKSVLTYITSQLIKKGYLVKVSSETDKRISLLNLTEESKKFLNEVRDNVRRKLNSLFENLGNEKKEKYKKIIQLINDIDLNVDDMKINGMENI